MHIKHTKHPLLLALTLTLSAINCNSALASDPETQAELRGMKTQLQTLSRDVETIKAAVLEIKRNFDEARQKRTPVQTVAVKLDESSLDDFSIGAATAPVTIMKFFDFQCGFCARFHKAVLPKIEQAYVTTGKVRIIYRDYVLASHPYAADAAAVASCAGEQGKYRQVLEALFDHPDLLNEGKLDLILEKIPGITAAKFKKCLETPPHSVIHSSTEAIPSAEAQADMQEGERIGVMGTPAFFVYRSAPAGTEVKGFFIRGDQELEVFKEIIEQILAE